MSEQMHTTNELCAIIKQRAEHGLKKYGTTLDREDLSEEDWLQHLLEEVCDAGGYILAAKRKIRDRETAIIAAVTLLEAGDPQSALVVLKELLPVRNTLPLNFELGDVNLSDVLPNPVVLVRDAGGA